MSDTYETYFTSSYPGQGPRRNLRLLTPAGITAVARFGVYGGITIVISKDEEQPQVAAAEPVQEEPDQDVPLDFDLTEAGFRGLPPSVDAGEKESEKIASWRQFEEVRAKEWEKACVGSLYGPLDFGDHYNPAVIPADAEGAPIVDLSRPCSCGHSGNLHGVADMFESACYVATCGCLNCRAESPEGALRRCLPAATIDRVVESWAAEAEAKRWRGDMPHITSHCNICGDKIAGPVGEVHCPTCREEGGLFDSFWRATDGGREAALEAWDAAAYKRVWPGARQPQPFA